MYENKVHLLQRKSTTRVAARRCKQSSLPFSVLHVTVQPGGWQGFGVQEQSLRGIKLKEALRKLRVLPATQLFIYTDRHRLLWQDFDCLAAELNKMPPCLRNHTSLGFTQKQPWAAALSWCPRAFPVDQVHWLPAFSFMSSLNE